MDQELIQILEMLAAVVMAVIAYWQNRQKTIAVQAKDEAVAGQQLAEAQQWEAEAEKADVVSFFDPQDDRVTQPPENVPTRSWKMNDETKKWVITGHTRTNRLHCFSRLLMQRRKRSCVTSSQCPGAITRSSTDCLKEVGKGGE